MYQISIIDQTQLWISLWRKKRHSDSCNDCALEPNWFIITEAWRGGATKSFLTYLLIYYQCRARDIEITTIQCNFPSIISLCSCYFICNNCKTPNPFHISINSILILRCRLIEREINTFFFWYILLENFFFLHLFFIFFVIKYILHLNESITDLRHVLRRESLFNTEWNEMNCTHKPEPIISFNKYTKKISVNAENEYFPCFQKMIHIVNAYVIVDGTRVIQRNNCFGNYKIQTRRD